MPGVGSQIIIGGQVYDKYSPQAQAAAEALARRQAEQQGGNAGLQQGTAARTAFETQYAPGSMQGIERAQEQARQAQQAAIAAQQAQAVAALARQREQEDLARQRRLDTENYTQQQFQNTRNTEADAYNRQLDSQNRASREGLINRIIGMGNGGGSGGGSNYPPPSQEIPFPSGNFPNVAPPPSSPEIQPVDTSAANSAIFAKAKDQAGQTSQGALAGLRSALGGRGMLGSGAESRGTASIINKGQQELGDVSRNLATETAKQNQENATNNYTGAITQRGQNINRETAMNTIAANQQATAYQGGITQRGQNIQAQQAAAAAEAQRRQSLQQILAGLAGAKY